MLSDLETLTIQVQTLFVHDAAGRLLYVNEPERPTAPRFFLGRTLAGNIWRFRHDLPEPLVRKLEALAKAEPISQDLHGAPRQAEAFQAVLAEHQPVQQVWSGPAYGFPGEAPWPADVVRITDAKAELLEGDFAWLRAVLAAKQPCVAAVVAGRAVSVCHSSRTSPLAAEAGLETPPEFRGRGYAAATVQGWAAAVRELGRTPLYSTSWENAASQRVAAKMELRLYASDFHIT